MHVRIFLPKSTNTLRVHAISLLSMASEGSPEPIDFDFFAEDDEDVVHSGRNSGHRGSTSPLVVTTKARPESAGSVRSAVSSRSSISVKIPSAGPTGARENAYSAKGRYTDSSDEEYFAKENRNDYKKGHQVQTNVNSDNDTGFGLGLNNENGRSGWEEEPRQRTSSSRPKTSKGPRSRRRQDSSSSRDSNTQQSNQSHSSSFSSKSEHSDSYTSISDSDSDVTDVSPLPSPARSPTPRLEYDEDEFEDSFEESRLRRAKTQSKSVSGDGKHKRTKPGKKESVRFAGVLPSNGTTSQRDKQLDETEARELSRLLRAVLELDNTPTRSQLNSSHRLSTTKQRPVSAKKAVATRAAPMPHQRVNLSFSNDKVRQIDRENQRLLRKILERPKSGSASGAVQARSRRGQDPHKMVSHSAICRQREQRKIEMENMKILERIEAARAHSTVQRNKLLQDHSQQMKYASQVSKGTRPQSAKTYGYGPSGGLGKGSSMASLNSEASCGSTVSAGSRKARPNDGRGMRPPPSGPRQAWDDRW